ncbi:hypothetical protein E3A20_16110 [Planctomyces bekefii]|uniref:SUF system FeS cluster assembly SufBD core domain-containing protein n=1 Tax=Planctomyces bekefii TaxID=1653850 RepID=A0A5C6M8D5_9PLAN|nr:hypothetical protein E3A20_16110 [Planctomyces bekefii]
MGPSDVAYLEVPYSELELAQEARLNYLRIQNEGAASSHIGMVEARVAAGAALHTFVYTDGGRLSRFDLQIDLLGEKAEARLDGLYLATGSQHVDHHTVVRHLAPEAKSSQVYKGVIGGAARAVFNGKIEVHSEAFQSEARQLNKNLLLTPEAEIDTKPELQIDTDDVKCSHGATVGRLNADELFYLKSRGIAAGEAEKMLIAAYGRDVISRMEDVKFRDLVLALAEAKSL